MPSSNRLYFLRPLYDIALWQYVIFTGSTCRKEERPHIYFTYRMHEIVANFLCKLLMAEAFSHLQSRLDNEDVKEATGCWKLGEEVTRELVLWCQDQWRRKAPVIPEKEYALNDFAPTSAVTVFGESMPVCHLCGVPCPECRAELAKEVPGEMTTIKSFMEYDAIQEGRDESHPAAVAEDSREATLPSPRRLRKRK